MSEKKIKVVFGLYAQGHIPLVEEKLKTWNPLWMDKNNWQVWKDIAEEIGWIDYAVCQDYIRYLQLKEKKLKDQLWAVLRDNNYGSSFEHSSLFSEIAEVLGGKEWELPDED